MDRSRFTWLRWPFRRGRSRVSQEAGAALFSGLRIRLTLWYCAVLAVALILFGTALYLGAQYFLLNPVEDNVAHHAQMDANQWLTSSPEHACSASEPPDQFNPPSSDRGQPMLEMIACFDQHGNLIQAEGTSSLPPALLSNSLAISALQNGSNSDIVNAGDDYGHIYRYAQIVPSPTGHGYAGVVVIGGIIEQQQSALSLLLTLLLAIGAVTLLGAGVGGLFLSSRALAPARLAWANQQRFIADAAHELRTPLTLMRADAEVLLRGRKRLDEEDAVLLEDIVAEANHMSNLATNMLTLARLDNRSTHREHEVVSLAEVAQAGVRRVQALADQEQITLQIKTGEPALVIGDRTLLEQAALVLLDNAIKYNRPGGHIAVRTAQEQEHAVLEVQDTGIGIANEHLLHLGERFYRVDKARSREAGGTGLGLSIARGIALAHNGTLTLTSSPNQGTTARLTLPLARMTPSDSTLNPSESAMSLPEQTM